MFVFDRCLILVPTPPPPSLSFSPLQYGPVAYHKQSLANLDAASSATGIPCAVVVDTLGRELTVRRVSHLDANGWPVIPDSVDVAAGTSVTVTPRPDAVLSPTLLPVTYGGLAEMVAPGDQLFVGRYLVNGAETSSLYLEVKEVRGADVVCAALNDATLSGLLTVIHADGGGDGGMSAAQASLPLFAASDLDAVADIAAAHAVDFVALTYTMSGEDVVAARDALDARGLSSAKIIAKVENRSALHAMGDILATADAVILSRGNLGLDVPAPKMAAVQKAAVAAANHAGKPVIITRLVDTMVTAPRCTRAEATDVANAVLDGVDAVMLGAETLRGVNPVETVATVRSIARQAELAFDHASHFDTLMLAQTQDELAAAEAAAVGGDDAAVHQMKKVSSFGSLPMGVNAAGIPSRLHTGNAPRPAAGGHAGAALPKVEAMASTAVRAAEKIRAAAIVVFAYTGRTTSLVAKYRPAMPVLTVVLPSERPGAPAGADPAASAATLCRQFLVMRGVTPVVGADGPTDAQLEAAVAEVVARGMGKGGDGIVVVAQHKGDLVLKIAAVDASGAGLCRVTAESNGDLVGLAA